MPQTPDVASSVAVVDTGRKRKHEDGSNDAVLKHSDCESDSDSDFACEAPDGGDRFSTASGERLKSGIGTVTYLKGGSGINSSSTKEPSSDRATQKALGNNNAPEVSVDESASDSEGEEAAQVEEVEPTISCVKVTLSSELRGSMSSTRRVWLMGDSWIHWLKKYTQKLYGSPNLGILQAEITWFDTNRSVTKPAPSLGLASPFKTDSSAIKVSYPLYPARVMNTSNDLAHVENLGNESYFQQNSVTKYPPFHPLFTFTPQLPRHFNPTPPPPPPTQPPPPPPPRPPPSPFNFYMPSPSSVPPFRPFFPPYLNLPPPFPHPPFPPPPHLNHMSYPSLPPR